MKRTSYTDEMLAFAKKVIEEDSLTYAEAAKKLEENFGIKVENVNSFRNALYNRNFRPSTERKPGPKPNTQVVLMPKQKAKPNDPGQEIRDSLASPELEAPIKITYYVPSLPEVFVKSRRMATPQVEDAVLIISDLHCGAMTKTINKMTWPTVIRGLTENVLNVCTHLLGYEIKKLHIWLLGDIVTGEMVFPGQWYETDLSAREQWSMATRELSAMISVYASIFQEVEVSCVPGNHGVSDKRIHPETNFDSFVYKAIEMLIKQKHSNVSFKMTDEFYQLVTVRGWDWILIHGEDLSYGGDPMTAAPKFSDRWQRSVGSHDGIAHGHMHTAISREHNGIHIFGNGTALSNDPYILSKFGVKSSTSQWLFGVSDKRSVTWQYKVSTAPPDLERDEREQKHKRALINKIFSGEK